MQSNDKISQVEWIAGKIDSNLGETECPCRQWGGHAYVLEALTCMKDIFGLQEDAMEREIRSLKETHAQEMAAQRAHFKVIAAMKVELDASK